jgi:hypothetical protein
VLADESDPDGDRWLRFHASGTWRDRLAELTAALAPWRADRPDERAS